MPSSFCERAVAVIDTAALQHNFRTVSALGGRTIAVIHANRVVCV